MAEYILSGLSEADKWCDAPKMLIKELDEDFKWKIFEFHDLDSLKECLNQISELKNTEQDIKETLTIFCHGDEGNLLLGNKRELKIPYQDIMPSLRDLKRSKPKLIFIFSVCEGSYIREIPDAPKSIFAFTFKIPLRLSILAAGCIVRAYHKGELDLNDIREEADARIKLYHKLVKLI